MKTEAEVRKFLESNPTASDDDLLRFATGGAPVNAAAAAAQQHAARGGALESNALAALNPAGLARSAAQGLSVGFSDEALGTARATLPHMVGGMVPGATPAPALMSLPTGDEINQAIDAERAALGTFRSAHPLAAMGAEMAGTAGPVLLTGGGAGAPTLGRTALEGAGWGAAYGAGTAEGGLAERAKGAGKGAVIGGVTAPVGFGVTRAVGAATEGPTNRAAGTLTRLAEKGGKTPGQIAEGFLRQPATVTLRTSEGPGFRALVPHALEPADKPKMVMDVLGAPGYRAARAARALSPKAGEAIDQALAQRMAGQEERIIGDVLQTTGVGGRTNAIQRVQDLIEERAANAKPLYDAARSFEVKDPRVLEVFRIPQFQQAYERARAIAALEGEILPDIFVRNAAGQVVDLAAKSIPVGTLDYVKRGMDDLIDSGFRAGGLGKPTARALKTRLNQMLSAVDELVPEYAQARAQYAGDSALMEAFDAGRNHWKGHPDQTAKTLANMTPGEQALYREGATEALAGKMEEVPARLDITKRKPLDQSTLDRRRLRQLFPDDATFQQFQQRLGEEVQMARGAQNVVGNSQTADKLADLADMAGLPIGETLSALTGHPTPLLKRIAGKKLSAYLEGMTATKAEALEPMLTATKRDILQKALQRIEEQRARDAVNRAVAGQIGRGLAAGTSLGVTGTW